MKGVYWLLGMAIVVAPGVYAGGFESLIFSEFGELLAPKEGADVPSEARIIQSRIQTTCPESQGKKCVEWDLAVPSGYTQTEQLLTRLQNVFSVFSNQPGFDVFFQHRSVIHDEGVPYQYVSNAIELDEFSNPIISGNFRVSLLPSPEMNFGEGESQTSTISLKYIRPDLETNQGEIMWSGVYFNPALTEGVDYSLERVMMNEAGRMIGMAPSAVRSSRMFPVLPGSEVAPVQLHSDDLAWIRSAYPASDAFLNRGSVSGEVINGDTGEKLIGAHIELIPLSKMNIFAQQGLATLGEVGGFSRKDGVFEIHGVPAGDYFVLIEKLGSIHPLVEVWDDATYVFGSPLDFVTEFYDGQGRESNHEAAYGFSPQLIFLAATVHVVEGETTSGIQIITNSVLQDIETIAAVGSSHETLAEINDDVDERLKSLKEAGPPAIPQAKTAFGLACSLRSDTSSTSHPHQGWSVVVALWALLLVGLKRESFRSGIQRFLRSDQ